MTCSRERSATPSSSYSKDSQESPNSNTDTHLLRLPDHLVHCGGMRFRHVLAPAHRHATYICIRVASVSPSPSPQHIQGQRRTVLSGLHAEWPLLGPRVALLALKLPLPLSRSLLLLPLFLHGQRTPRGEPRARLACVRPGRPQLRLRLWFGSAALRPREDVGRVGQVVLGARGLGGRCGGR